MVTNDATTATADVIRSVVARFVECEHDVDALDRARDLLAQVLVELNGPPSASYWDDPDQDLDPESAASYLDHTPFGGLKNPLMPPPLSLDRIPDGGHFRLTSEVVFGRVFEGGPGMLHGGILAGMFDHFFGLAQGGKGAATLWLTTWYRKPTPLGRRLRFVVQYEDVDERTLRGTGTCTVDEVVTAEAEGLFRKIDFRALGLRSLGQ